MDSDFWDTLCKTVLTFFFFLNSLQCDLFLFLFVLFLHPNELQTKIPNNSRRMMMGFHLSMLTMDLSTAYFGQNWQKNKMFIPSPSLTFFTSKSLMGLVGV